MKRLLIFSAFFAVGLFNLTGCSSYFKRQDCENINWFDHGQKVALRGEWLNADKTLQECRQAEAHINEVQLDQGFKAGMQQYCSAPKAYQIGKAGDLFARGLCEGPSINSILSQHAQGIRDYCSKANSVAAGASGKKYQNVCPVSLEKDFLPGYRRGRKKYVETVIKDKETQRQELGSALTNKQAELIMVQGELNNLQNRRSYLDMQRSNALSVQNPVQAGYLEGQINSLSNDISMKQNTVRLKQSELDSNRKQQENLSTEISTLRTEIPSLED